MLLNTYICVNPLNKETNETYFNCKGWIVLDQIRTIDKQRIIKELGRLTKPEINKLKAVLKETYID